MRNKDRLAELYFWVRPHPPTPKALPTYVAMIPNEAIIVPGRAHNWRRKGSHLVHLVDTRFTEQESAIVSQIEKLPIAIAVQP